MVRRIGAFCLLCACLWLGCQPPIGPAVNQVQATNGQPGFGPERLIITPLTHITGSADKAGYRVVRVYARLVDGFDCDVKAPGVFRFELYQVVPRSAEPRGARLAIWPDMDLNDPSENHRYWHEILRMYVFDLNLSMEIEGAYVLEGTFIRSDGRRITGQYILGLSR